MPVMLRRIVIASVIIFLLATPAAAVDINNAPVNDYSKPDYVTKSGGTVELTPTQERQYRGQLDNITEEIPMDMRDHIFAMVAGDGETTLVIADEPPQTAEATISGTLFTASDLDGASFSVLFADRVEWSTEATSVTRTELLEDPERFRGELVSLTSPYRQMSFAIDTEDQTLVQQNTYGVIGPVSQEGFSRPAQTARSATINISHSQNDADVQGVDAFVRQTDGTIPVIDNAGTQLWIDSRSEITGVVTVQNGHPVLYLRNAEPTSTDLNGMESLSEYSDEVVTVEANLLGARISTQESLLQSARCAPQSITVPGAGCIPLPVDTALYAGVGFGESVQSSEDVIVVAGVGNAHQSRPTTELQGRYTLTGRVVSTHDIDPRLPAGSALLLYDIDRRGDIQVSNGLSTATHLRTQRVDTIQSGVYQRSLEASETPVTSTPATNDSTGDSTDTGAEPNQSTQTRSPVAETAHSKGRANLLSAMMPNISTLALQAIFGGVLIIAWPSAILIEVLRAVRTWRGHPVETTRRPATILFSGGGLAGLALLFVSGYSGILVGLIVVPVLLTAFVGGWYWVYQNI